MRRAVLLLSVVGIMVLFCQPAQATKHCAPLPITSTSGCRCAVQNYGIAKDTGLKIEIFSTAGSFGACSNLTVPPKGSTYCQGNITEGNTCGCVVTGEGALTLVSLSVVDSSGVAHASIECN